MQTDNVSMTSLFLSYALYDVNHADAVVILTKARETGKVCSERSGGRWSSQEARPDGRHRTE